MDNIIKNIENTTQPYYQNRIKLQLDFYFKTSCRIYFPDNNYKDLINHLYKFTITISSHVNEYGIAVDFFYIKGLYDMHLDDILNSEVLNKALPEINPTAENLCYFIWKSFKSFMPEDVIMEEIIFSENEHHRVILNRNFFD